MAGGAVSPVANDLGGYSIMQGESKEAVAATMKERDLRATGRERRAKTLLVHVTVDSVTIDDRRATPSSP
ncbi:MAG TPA: hypothetical protein VF403_25780 [Kofleriaceae bacterium]